jgi:exodeoxyribonuclease VII large subunit
MDERMIFTVSDFVALLNQTLEIAYPFVTIEGELSNFKVSRNRWVYFDLKDESASVRFFGTVYALPGPLEDGIRVRVSGNPRLHSQYGFSVSVQSITPIGEGSLKRAANLLEAKLAAEGLFAPERKRLLPYPPQRIALVTAGNSAAYADFMKILNVRWRGATVDHYEVQVQGEPAPAQITAAITAANANAVPYDVLVLTRGGGSADDLAAFNAEVVVRAVATSRVPTLVAIGHEIDTSLAELAADKRASTPTNAAELLAPDRATELKRLHERRIALDTVLLRLVADRKAHVTRQQVELNHALSGTYERAQTKLQAVRQLLVAYDPQSALKRGYALVRVGDVVMTSVNQLSAGAEVELQLKDGIATATITTKEQN